MLTPEFTVVVIPAGARTFRGTHVTYESTVIIQNTDTALEELRSKTVVKTVLVDLKETELLPRLRLLLISAMMASLQVNGNQIYFIEV